jgi:hypothetical protein
MKFIKGDKKGKKLLEREIALRDEEVDKSQQLVEAISLVEVEEC